MRKITPRSVQDKSPQEQSNQNESDSDLFSETISSNVFRCSTEFRFADSIWIRECLMKNYDRNTLNMCFPHGVSEHGELTLIGKTRIKLSQSGKLTEKIGQAKKLTCRLETCHANKVHELDKFVVLNFNDSNCYDWLPFDLMISKPGSSSSRTNKSCFMLKLGYDTVTHSVLYAGRGVVKNCKYTGCLIAADNQLLVPYKNEPVCLKTFEVLCLKPSPNSLKNICKQSIRDIMRHDNSRIKNLKFFLEPSLLKFVKYKNFLKCGSQLRTGEYLISNNGEYQLK